MLGKSRKKNLSHKDSKAQYLVNQTDLHATGFLQGLILEETVKARVYKESAFFEVCQIRFLYFEVAISNLG